MIRWDHFVIAYEWIKRITVAFAVIVFIGFNFHFCAHLFFQNKKINKYIFTQNKPNLDCRWGAQKWWDNSAQSRTHYSYFQCSSVAILTLDSWIYSLFPQNWHSIWAHTLHCHCSPQICPNQCRPRFGSDFYCSILEIAQKYVRRVRVTQTFGFVTVKHCQMMEGGSKDVK